MAILVLNLGVTLWAVHLFGNDGALMTLPWALPVAAIALAHWMAGLVAAHDCTCGKTRVLRK